jgi:hypothetical protein
LDQMETCVGEMMGLLYNVDLFLERPQERVAGGKDPKAALEHVSELFHVSGRTSSEAEAESLPCCI